MPPSPFSPPPSSSWSSGHESAKKRSAGFSSSKVQTSQELEAAKNPLPLPLPLSPLCVWVGPNGCLHRRRRLTEEGGRVNKPSLLLLLFLLPVIGFLVIICVHPSCMSGERGRGREGLPCKIFRLLVGSVARVLIRRPPLIFSLTTAQPPVSCSVMMGEGPRRRLGSNLFIKSLAKSQTRRIAH